MGKAEVAVKVYNGDSVLKTWVQPCEKDLPQIVEAVKLVKQSVNEYLTLLIDKDRDFNLIDQRELESDSLEDEVNSDFVPGYIKNVAIATEKSKACDKRKVNNVTKAKRLKK